MKKGNKNMELLGSAPIFRALLAMGLPTMLGMLVNSLYSLVDAYFVGGLGTREMGAVSVTYPLGQVVVGVGLLFGSGAASYLSRLLGKGEKEKADQAASSAVYGSLLAGAAVIALSLALLTPLLKALGATGSILPCAESYARIYLAASVFNIFNVTMNSIVTSEGQARISMCALLTGAALNIVLDPILIYGLDFQVEGAAVATALSQLASTLVYLSYILSGKSVFSFRIRSCRFSREILFEIFRIGVPTMLFQLLTSFSMACVNGAAKGYGDSVLAGIGAAFRVLSMGSLVVFGFIKGFQPVAGYSYGAKKYGRLREAVKTAVLWSTAFCLLFGAVLMFFPGAILSCFTKGDEEMIQTGAAFLRANGFSFLVFGFYTVYSSLFLALGKAGAGLFLGAARQGICFVPSILLLPAFFGLNGIIWAQPIADFLAGGLAALMAVRLSKRLRCEET